MLCSKAHLWLQLQLVDRQTGRQLWKWVTVFWKKQQNELKVSFQFHGSIYTVEKK